MGVHTSKTDQELTGRAAPCDRDALAATCGEIAAAGLRVAALEGDQFDMSRALVQATQYGKACSARLDALVDAIDVRDQIMATVKTQLEKR